jgi:hypothetical protein
MAYYQDHNGRRSKSLAFAKDAVQPGKAGNPALNYLPCEQGDFIPDWARLQTCLA